MARMIPGQQDLLNRVDAERISRLTLDLVRIPSPSGKEAEATEFFTDYLREVGLEVSLDETFPESPSIIAYARGSSAGATLQLDGHIDTVPIEHPPAETK